MIASTLQIPKCRNCGTEMPGTKHTVFCSEDCVMEFENELRNENIREKAQETEDEKLFQKAQWDDEEGEAQAETEDGRR